MSGAYLLQNAVSYDGEILHTDAYRPCAKHLLGFMSKWVVVNDIFKRITCMSANSFAAVTGRSAGWAGWLQLRPVLLIVLLLIAQARHWLCKGLQAGWP